MIIENKSVAETLKAARTEKKLQIKALSADICIRTDYLTAIEEADYSALPGHTFAIGFVKSYAAALGLDAAEIAVQFKEEYCPAQSEFATATTSAATIKKITVKAKPRRKVPTWLMPVFGLIGATACWAVLGGGFGSVTLPADAGVDGVAFEEARLAAVQANISKPADSQAAGYMLAGGQSVVDQSATARNDSDMATDDESVQTVSAAVVPATRTEKPTLDTTAHPSRETSGEQSAYTGSFFTPPVHAAGDTIVGAKADFRLEAIEDSWVRLANIDGTEIWSGILRQGQTYRPQTSGLVLLSTSNAGGVKLQVGTDTASILGGRGEIISALRLEETALLTAHDDVLVSALGSR